MIGAHPAADIVDGGCVAGVGCGEWPAVALAGVVCFGSPARRDGGVVGQVAGMGMRRMVSIAVAGCVAQGQVRDSRSHR
jgi:hypothetical protein